MSSLDELSKELLGRLEREVQRPDGTSGTERVGGVNRIGGRLEALLRGALLHAAEIDACDALAAIQALQPKADSVDRVTMGTLATALRDWNGPASDAPVLAPLIEDLGAGKSSVLWRVINYRNDVAHGRREADDAPEIADALALWLRAYRRNLRS